MRRRTGLVVSRLLARWSAPTLIQFALFGVSGLLVVMSLSSPLYLVTFTAGFGFFNALNRIARTNWMHHQVDMNIRGRIDGAMGMLSPPENLLSSVYGYQTAGKQSVKCFNTSEPPVKYL